MMTREGIWSRLSSWGKPHLAELALEKGNEEVMGEGLKQAQIAADAAREVHEEMALAKGMDVRARLHLALGRAEEAWHDSSQAMQLLESHPWLPMPQTHLHTHFLALRALDRKEEALDHLRRARDRVMFVADKLADERLRQSWLQNVRMNREILEDWSEIHPLGSGTGKLA
jgi:hypothetical protein